MSTDSERDRADHNKRQLQKLAVHVTSPMEAALACAQIAASYRTMDGKLNPWGKKIVQEIEIFASLLSESGAGLTPRWREKDQDSGDDLIELWKKRPRHSDEYAAAEIIEQLERELAESRSLHSDMCREVERLTAERFARSATGLSALERFALSILESHRNDGYPGDIDGGFAQEEAVRCGVLVEKEVTGPCNSETCSCAEVHDFPTTCYFLSEETEAKRAILNNVDRRGKS